METNDWPNPATSLNPSVEGQPAGDLRQAGDSRFAKYADWTEAANPLPDALDCYTRALERDTLGTDETLVMARMAKAYLLSGRFDSADSLLTRLSQRDLSGNREAAVQVAEAKGFLACYQGRYAEAVKGFKAALRLAPHQHKVRLRLGLVGVHLDQLRHGGDGWRMWTGLAGHLGAAMLSPAFYGMLPGAVKRLGVLGELTWARLQRPETRLQQAFKLFRKYPGLDSVPLEIGRYYLEEEQFTDAAYWFDIARRRHPTREGAYQGLLEVYGKTYDNDQLITLLQAWLKLRPAQADLMLLLSQSLAIEPSRTEDAMMWARKALTCLTDPQQVAMVYQHLGAVYAANDDLEEATLAYQAAIHLMPENLDAWLKLGALYFDGNAYGLSEQAFNRALALSPGNARVLCNLGYLAWMQDDIPRARSFYHLSITEDPTYDIALNNLGVLYLDHIGDVRQALALFDQALHHNAQYALSYYNKGRAYSFLGKPVEAATCFRRAQELNGQSEELDNQELNERIAALFDGNFGASMDHYGPGATTDFEATGLG